MPAETVFDQGLGELFVIRVAANIVAPSRVGGVEFAAECSGSRLVVVLGHSRCNAILATVEELGSPTADQSPNLRSIVDYMLPPVEPLMDTELRQNPEALVKHTVGANIRPSVNHLRHGPRLLQQLIQKNGLLIVGVEYSLETGVIDFFGHLPAQS